MQGTNNRGQDARSDLPLGTPILKGSHSRVFFIFPALLFSLISVLVQEVWPDLQRQRVIDLEESLKSLLI